MLLFYKFLKTHIVIIIFSEDFHTILDNRFQNINGCRFYKILRKQSVALTWNLRTYKVAVAQQYKNLFC